MSSNGNDTDLDPVTSQPGDEQESAPEHREQEAASADELASQAPDAAALAAERDDIRDRLLRVTAEFDNYRKRVDRERREMADRAAEGVLADLLPIVDDLERALDTAAADDAARAYRTGVELIHRQLLELLARRGVTPIETVGEDFDPHVHQAVATEPAGHRRDGEVVEDLRRGYQLRDRLLRAAMVKVAKA